MIAAVLVLTAMGLSIVFGVMRVVNAHGEFFMLGAVIAWTVAYSLGAHPAIGFWPHYHRTSARRCSRRYRRIILQKIDYDPDRTIVGTIVVHHPTNDLDDIRSRRKASGATFNQRLALPWFEFGESGFQLYWPWGLSITSYKLFIIVAAIILLIGLWLLMTRTRIGLVMRATQQDSEMAGAFGVPVKSVYAWVFGLGAGLAAVGAVLIVPVQQAHYLMGNEPLLLSFIVVIIGGLGSLPGTVIAALLIGMSDGIISVFFSPTLAKIIATLLVAMVLVFRPQGLMGKLQR